MPFLKFSVLSPNPAPLFLLWLKSLPAEVPSLSHRPGAFRAGCPPVPSAHWLFRPWAWPRKCVFSRSAPKVAQLGGGADPGSLVPAQASPEVGVEITRPLGSPPEGMLGFSSKCKRSRDWRQLSSYHESSSCLLRSPSCVPLPLSRPFPSSPPLPHTQPSPPCFPSQLCF